MAFWEDYRICLGFLRVEFRIDFGFFNRSYLVLGIVE